MFIETQNEFLYTILLLWEGFFYLPFTHMFVSLAFSLFATPTHSSERFSGSVLCQALSWRKCDPFFYCFLWKEQIVALTAGVVVFPFFPVVVFPHVPDVLHHWQILELIAFEFMIWLMLFSHLCLSDLGLTILWPWETWMKNFSTLLRSWSSLTHMHAVILS